MKYIVQGLTPQHRIRASVMLVGIPNLYTLSNCALQLYIKIITLYMYDVSYQRLELMAV